MNVSITRPIGGLCIDLSSPGDQHQLHESFGPEEAIGLRGVVCCPQIHLECHIVGLAKPQSRQRKAPLLP